MRKWSAMLSKGKYQMLLEHSQEIILFFDQSGIISDCNRKAMESLGYDENIKGTPISDIFQKAVKSSNGRPIYMKGREKAAETVAYRKNQTCFMVELKIFISENAKNFIGVCFAIDISDKKKLYKVSKHLRSEVKSLKQLKNEFVANITHELRTPVNGIMGLTDILLETELTPKQLENVNLIHRCCKNMNTLINDLLDMAKISSNKLILEKREFNLLKMIEGIVALNIVRINEKGLKLIVNVSDDIPNIVIGDEYRLAQILNNLLSNATKFTSIGQIVLEVVKTAQTEEEIELFFMVIDSGIGISLEERDKLFHSFSQVDGSITRRFGGSGLGLSICRMLVEAMHGTITVESEKGKGSTFSFSVRLGVSANNSETSPNKNDGHADSRKEAFTRPEDNWYNETDYIGLLLQEAGLSSYSLKDTDMTERLEVKEPIETFLLNLNGCIEKLMICIEMESWENAEDLAGFIREMLPASYKQIKNKALQLLLVIRKENHDQSISQLKELEKALNEVTEWKI